MCQIPIQLLFVYVPCSLLLFFFFFCLCFRLSELLFSPFQGTTSHCLSFHFNILLNPFVLSDFGVPFECVCVCAVCSVPVVVIQMLHADCDAIAFYTGTQLFGICLSLSLTLALFVYFFLHHHRFSWEPEQIYTVQHKCQCFRSGMCHFVCMPVERIACALLLYSLCSNTLNLLFIHLQKWVWSVAVDGTCI